MFNRWVVKVKVSYNTLFFEFDSADKAVEFAKMALESAHPYRDHDGDVTIATVSIYTKSNDDEEDE